MELLHDDYDSLHPPLSDDEEVIHIEQEKDAEIVPIEGESEANLIRRDLSIKLFVGKTVSDPEEAYKLYCDYAHTLGFSVRRYKQYTSGKPPQLKRKEFCCWKRGFKNNKRSCEETFMKRDTRTGCEVMIVFVLNEEGTWTVAKFIEEHNHEFAASEERHLLKSARRISKEKGKTLISMVNAGISTISAFSYLANESGGSEALGFSKKDCYNYINAQKMVLIEAGDSQSLLNYFKGKVDEEGGMFYWDVQVDQEGRMTNFYWRDAQSRIDYDCFGDVVVFDTTYRTNRYNLVCAPFVGVNQHWQNTMFGCAFLLDETTASFEWLFSTFLKSMGNQPPKTIFTDQDQAMANAIEKVFPSTSHRLCLWHISKNAPSHLGGLNNDQGFHHLFNKCLQGCESEKEFEDTWSMMMLKYDVKEHKWLQNLYKIRQKWCTAFNKHTFDGRIKSSQRSESTNNVLNGIANKSTSLTKFVIGFEHFVNRWRKNEAEENYNCHQSKPSRANMHSSILKHAAGVFTHKLYKLVEKEYLDGTGACDIHEIEADGTSNKFECRMQGNNSNVHIIHFNKSSLDLACTCAKFVTLGILCCHAFAVLKQKNIPVIPMKYIPKRWSNEARKRVHDYNCNVVHKDLNEAEAVFRNRAMRYAYDLIHMSQGKEETRKLMWEILDNGHEVLEKLMKEISLDANGVFEKDSVKEINSGNDEPPILDPPIAKTKGAPNSRKKGHFERRKRKQAPNRGKEKTITRAAKQPNLSEEAQRVNLEEVNPSITSQPIVSQPYFGCPTQLSGMNFYQVYPTNTNMYMPSFNGSFMSTLHGVSSVNHLPQDDANSPWKPPSTM